MMSYPVWEPFLNNGLLMALVAIPHVFVSHFAIGGGLYLVLAESWARRKNDQAHLAYVERHSKFFVLITLVFGAVTGVGIWVTIGLIHPVGTKWLINNFVWGWATEWVFFFVEIAAAMIYYYGWKRLSARTHLAVGWIYFIAAWLSLFIINGIIAFMLTPGEWVTTGNFWDGFFNPTFWPTTFLRTFIALALAGLYAIFTVAKEKNKDVKTVIMRRNGILVLGSLALCVPFGLWYFGAIPGMATMLPGSIPSIARQIMVFFAALLFVLTLLGAIVFPRKAGYISGAILLVIGLISMGGFEWFRESIRKPYIISDFLYSNSITVAQAENLPARKPMTIAISTGDRGHDIFLHACRSCHSITGYMSLSDNLAGLDERHIANIIPRLQYFIGKMPPFPGNEDDAAALTAYLVARADPEPLSAHASLTEQQKGDIVFERRCGVCHTMTGYRPLAATFSGLGYDDAVETFEFLGEMADGMPPYTGDDEETRLLYNHLTGGGQ